MRILYIDIDSLRPDHLGCYGYARNTSPNIDRIAADGVRFTNCHASDAPCLPSRTALFSGRSGIHTGVVNHGGVAAQPFIEGPTRAFKDRFGTTSWPTLLRKPGSKAVAISSFGERHSAWHYYAGFNEILSTGKNGNENADEVSSIARSWLSRHGREEQWFMHLNFWDPHTPYRVPEHYGNPFEDEPYPGWITPAVRELHWRGCGPHSAREVMGYSDEVPAYLAGRSLPRQPWKVDSEEAVRAVFDGYDTGVRYADEHVGRVLQHLAELDVLDETAILISADHGENLGELNIYGDHQTADSITCRVPMIVRWPGVTENQAGRVDDSLHYAFDFAATAVELCGSKVPECWDGKSFATEFAHGRSQPREYLVLSQGAWCVQRSVRWADYIYLRTYHDAWHGFPEELLFNLLSDPHEQYNLAEQKPELIATGRHLLHRWREEMLATSTSGIDPLETVCAEGGSLHARECGDYLERLRKTGRGEAAARFERRTLCASIT